VVKDVNSASNAKLNSKESSLQQTEPKRKPESKVSSEAPQKQPDLTTPSSHVNNTLSASNSSNPKGPSQRLRSDGLEEEQNQELIEQLRLESIMKVMEDRNLDEDNEEMQELMRLTNEQWF